MTGSLFGRRAALGAALAAAAPVIRRAAAADPIRIGLIVSYSGSYADYGKQMDGGMALWLKEHGGELAGRPVEIIRRDTAGAAPDLATRFARELITRDRVGFLLGHDFSPNALAIAPIVTQAKVPAIVLNASASVIPSRSPYIARLSFTVGQALLHKPCR